MTIKDRKFLEIAQNRNGMAKGAWGKCNVRIIFNKIQQRKLWGKKTKGNHKSESKGSYDDTITFWTKIFIANKIGLKWV